MTSLNARRDFLGASRHLLKHFFEILSPFADRKLGDFDGGISNLVEQTADFVLVLFGPLNTPLMMVNPLFVSFISP